MAYTVASGLNTGKTKMRLADFLPRWGSQRRQTADEQLALLREMAARQNARQKDANVHNR